MAPIFCKQAEPTKPDPNRTFTRHAETLRQRNGLDAEKADGIVALKMAQTGWKPEDIASALKTARLNTDLSLPSEVDAYAKKLTVQAVGKAAREAAMERNNRSYDLERWPFLAGRALPHVAALRSSTPHPSSHKPRSPERSRPTELVTPLGNGHAL